jgi:hypothetical protein
LGHLATVVLTSSRLAASFLAKALLHLSYNGNAKIHTKGVFMKIKRAVKKSQRSSKKSPQKSTPEPSPSIPEDLLLDINLSHRYLETFPPGY